MKNEKSEKKNFIALILVVLFGMLGAHRFYVGKTGSGILYIFTAGGFLIGAMIDFFMILAGNFTDAKGKKLKWE